MPKKKDLKKFEERHKDLIKNMVDKNACPNEITTKLNELDGIAESSKKKKFHYNEVRNDAIFDFYNAIWDPSTKKYKKYEQINMFGNKPSENTPETNDVSNADDSPSNISNDNTQIPQNDNPKQDINDTSPKETSNSKDVELLVNESMKSLYKELQTISLRIKNLEDLAISFNNYIAGIKKENPKNEPLIPAKKLIEHYSTYGVRHNTPISETIRKEVIQRIEKQYGITNNQSKAIDTALLHYLYNSTITDKPK